MVTKYNIGETVQNELKRTIFKGESIGIMNPSFDHVAFFSSNWSKQFRRHLFISIARTGKNSRILCVQRPLCSITSIFRSRREMVDWCIGKNRLIRILPNLFVYQPITFLHDHISQHVPCTNMLNRKMFQRKLWK